MVGEVVVVVEVSFESGELGWGDVELGGEGGEGDAGVEALLADLCAGGDVGGWVGDDVVDLSGDEAFEAAHDFLAGLAFGGASGDVGAGAGVVAHSDQDDGVECVVGAAVTAGVEPVALGFA